MRSKLSAIALLAVSMSSAAACTRIGPGYVGIKVSMAGDSRGVNSAPAVTGWTFYNPFLSSVFEYPTFVQTAQWTRSKDEGNPVNEEITFTNADQMLIGADISLSYHLEPEKVPAFYVMFRSDDLSKFTHGFLRNAARDEFDRQGGRYKIEQIMGDNSEFLKSVRDALQTELTPLGVKLDQFGFIGAPRPPQQVIDAINAKVHAVQLAQQKQNELVQAQADAAKQVATAEGAASSAIATARGEAQSILLNADAQATANKKLADSITPQLLELKRLERWDGALPQVNGGSTNPFISLERRQQQQQ